MASPLPIADAVAPIASSLAVIIPGFSVAVEWIGTIMEAAGVLVIASGLIVATVRFVVPALRCGDDRYRQYRQDLGRAILLGLEFLVAGDIVRTVVVDPTLESVTVLGLIVLIRTFLSFTLEVELEGRWPWQRERPGPPPEKS